MCECIKNIFKYIGFYIIKIIKGLPAFLLWSFISFIISLIGVWLPCLILHIEQGTIREFFLNPNNSIYKKMLLTNPYLIYSVTFLAETYLSTIPFHVLKKDKVVLYYLKWVLSAACIIYLFVIVAFIGRTAGLLEFKEIGNQRVFLWITIGIGLLLYLIRDKQKNDFDKIEKKNQKAIKALVKNKNSQGDDDAAV